MTRRCGRTWSAAGEKYARIINGSSWRGERVDRVRSACGERDAIIIDDDIVELEPREPTSFCVKGPRNELETQAKLGFSGHWAALGGRRRSEQRRGLAREQRASSTINSPTV